MIQLLKPETVVVNRQVSGWREVVTLAGKLLYRVGVVNDKYVRAMVQMVENLGPYIVVSPGIALAHARPEDGALGNGISLVTLRPEVYFGNVDNDPVRIVIGLAAKNEAEHIKLLSKVAKAFHVPGFKEWLFNVESVNELFEAKQGFGWER